MDVCVYHSSQIHIRFCWAINSRCCHIMPTISASSILMKINKNLRTLFDFHGPWLDLQSCQRKILRNEQARYRLWATYVESTFIATFAKLRGFWQKFILGAAMAGYKVFSEKDPSVTESWSIMTPCFISHSSSYSLEKGKGHALWFNLRRALLGCVRICLIKSLF